jgi:hypothetical protein
MLMAPLEERCFAWYGCRCVDSKCVCVHYSAFRHECMMYADDNGGNECHSMTGQRRESRIPQVACASTSTRNGSAGCSTILASTTAARREQRPRTNAKQRNPEDQLTAKPFELSLFISKQPSSVRVPLLPHYLLDYLLFPPTQNPHVGIYARSSHL